MMNPPEPGHDAPTEFYRLRRVHAFFFCVNKMFDDWGAKGENGFAIKCAAAEKKII